MAATTDPIVSFTGVSKQYGALRPLRMDGLVLSRGDEVAVIGLDQPAAEVLISLLTGAGLPDSGTVDLFGRPTSAIADSQEWLGLLDHFGIVSDRAALLEPMTALQNLAMPFTLDIEPPPVEIAAQAATLAREVGLDASLLDRRVGDLDPLSKLRVRLGRAVALNPSLLILEHPSASLPRTDVVPFACDVRAVSARRRLATLTLTADGELAGAISARALLLDLATGRLRRP